MKVWTDEEDAKVMEMVASGQTRSQIAKAFGVTKNAICGKVHRMQNTQPTMDESWPADHVAGLLKKAPYVVRCRFSTSKQMAAIDVYYHEGRDEYTALVRRLESRGWLWKGSHNEMPDGIVGLIYRHDDYSFVHKARTKELISRVADFKPRDEVPNAETIAAFAEIEAGGGEVMSGTVEEVFDEILSQPDEDAAPPVAPIEDRREPVRTVAPKPPYGTTINGITYRYDESEPDDVRNARLERIRMAQEAAWFARGLSRNEIIKLFEGWPTKLGYPDYWWEVGKAPAPRRP